MEDFQIYSLPNQIRIVYKQVYNTKIAHCGYILDIGSRDENTSEIGIAHFWEHMAFKGTQNRKSFHILNRLDSVGGDLNAYTTKEKICFHASLLENHIEKAIDLLTDITFYSTFPEKEIIKEKSVILEEMAMYEEDPSDYIFDHFDELIFENHPLGNNILGTQTSVEKFTQSDFFNFINKNLSNDKVIFSIVTSIPFSKIKPLLEKYLTKIPAQSTSVKRQKASLYTPKSITKTVNSSRVHYLMGAPAYSFVDNYRIPFFLLTNILGGPSLNSRLNLSLREKHALVYSVEANFSSFTDTGLASIYFATESNTFEKSLNLVQKELKSIKTKKLGSLQLHSAKNQLMGQIAMAEESNLGMMLMLGKSILDAGKVENLNSIFDKIKQITTDDILHVANEIYDESKISELIYKPEK